MEITFALNWLVPVVLTVIIPIFAAHVKMQTVRYTELTNRLNTMQHDSRTEHKSDVASIYTSLDALRRELKEDRNAVNNAHTKLTSEMVTRSEFAGRMDKLTDLVTSNR